MSRALLDDPFAEDAITWMVEMKSGEMSAQQQQAFAAWLEADIRNENAWVRLQEGLMPCLVASRHDLPKGTLTSNILRRRQKRRDILMGIAGLAGVGSAGLIAADSILPIENLLADQVTRTAEKREVTLADGSELVLKPRTAVDLASGQQGRVIQLRDGEILARISEGSVPFRVSLGRYELATDKGQFIVNRDKERAVVTGIEGEGRFGWDSDMQPVLAGDEVILEQNRFSRRSADLETATAWLDGLLIAKDKTVSNVVDGLRPYFAGVIRVDPAVADRRVTGVFSLKDPNGAMDALARSMNLSVTRILGRWVTLSA